MDPIAHWPPEMAHRINRYPQVRLSLLQALDEEVELGASNVQLLEDIWTAIEEVHSVDDAGKDGHGIPNPQQEN